MTTEINAAAVASAPAYGRIAVIGAGLIGGSIAHALRQGTVCERVVTYDANAQHAREALAKGLVQEVAETLSDAVAGADAVILAVPVRLTAQLLPEVVQHLAADALVMDMGSVKGAFTREGAALAPEVACRVVPCHPIAGHVTSGPAMADAGLMRGRLMIITPASVVGQDAIDRVRSLWTAVGFDVLQMTAQEHDAAYADLSHMPHVASFALMHHLAATPLDRALLLRLGGNAVKDMTRFAASNPRMWRDILVENRGEVLRALASFRGSLEQLEALIQREDAPALEHLLEEIQASRPAGWSAVPAPASRP